MTCYKRVFSVLLLVVMVCAALGTSESRTAREQRNREIRRQEAVERLLDILHQQTSLANEGKCHVCPICGLVHGGLPSTRDNTTESQEMYNTKNSEPVSME